jgi:ACS family hexuronate transporter-like MFS transporter
MVAAIGYTPFFIGLAALDLLGAVVLWTVVREPHATMPAPGSTGGTT